AGEGSPREGGAARELNVPNWALGDQLLLALTASPLKDNMAMLETGDFRGNRITNEGVSKLCLQLSQYCPHLWRLRLSDVGIGYDADTGGALGILLVAMPKLRLLDVSFNMLGGQGAIAFVKGLQSSRLRCLDLSWNSLGKGPHCKSVAEELATAVSVVETLQHLDISFNCLQVQEMDILAKAVRSSRHIWGIHVDGNAAYVDINGVLTAMPVGYLPEDDARPKPARSSSKKGKAGKKAKQKSKDSADAEICVAGTLLTPGELQARLQALQWHLRLSDLSEEYQKKADEEEKEQLKEKTRSIASIGGTLSLSLFSKDKDADDDSSRIPMSLPEIIRRRPPGEALSPRSQNEMLQSLALETKPEVTASLKAKTAGRTHGELYLHCGKEGLNSKHTNCRLCNEWVKVEFEVLTDDLVVDLPLPGVETPAFEVCVFLSLDNFSQALPLEFKDGSWTGTRFLPPAERMFAVFQIAGKLCVHQRLPARALQQPLEIPLWSPDGDGQTETAIVGEINVVRLGSLALGYCNDVEPSQ
ncbi:Tcte1, partial [Symbiodinium microadriaticum]